MVQRMSLGWFRDYKRVEFVTMRGPQGKGRAEMAISRVKGSGPETPCQTPSAENFPIEDFDEVWMFLHDAKSPLTTFIQRWVVMLSKPLLFDWTHNGYGQHLCIVVTSELEMCGNGFQHSHSLPFPSIQFPFPTIPIPIFLTYSHSDGIPMWAIPIPSHSHSVNAKVVYN